MQKVAFYLGQYHPIKENNEFWGDGFTEWHNVVRARPLFPGHRQPILPGKFGFYDLRCEETIEQQLEHAKYIGINAMCYWHYWFEGKRILYTPLDKMLEVNNHDVKFMLAWANESWSGVWHGNPGRILIRQGYSSRELKLHAELISDYIMSGKYLRLPDGRYPFYIYKPKQIPNTREYITKLRKSIENNIKEELYIIGEWNSGEAGVIYNPGKYGLDGIVVSSGFGKTLENNIYNLTFAIGSKVFRTLKRIPKFAEYRSISRNIINICSNIQGEAHPGILTGWDNTPRSGRKGLVFYGYNDATFRESIIESLNIESKNNNQLLFVKSWNEWAEGNVLEPIFEQSWDAGEIFRSTVSEWNSAVMRDI